MKILFRSLLIVVVLSLSLPVFAIDDPYFTQTLVGASGSWDLGATVATDSISGLTTLKYQLSSSFNNFKTGDLLITLTSGGPVVDLIRFETLGASGTDPVAFIFSSQSYGLPDDVGLPTTYQSNTATDLISNVYIPNSNQPGYVGTGGATAWEYELAPAPAPEPGTMMLLGVGMLGLAIYSKRRMNNKA